MKLGVAQLSSLIKRLVEKPIKELGTTNEPSVLVSQLHKRQEESGSQLDSKPTRQRQKVITLEQQLLIWFKKKDVTSNYAKSHNLHVM